MFKNILFFIVLTIGINANSTSLSPLAKSALMAKLTKIQNISLDNFSNVGDLLYEVSSHLNVQWDTDLIREAGRVLNLSMRFNSKSYVFTTEPFYLILASTKKDQFLQATLPHLDEKNQETFKTDVKLLFQGPIP